MSASHAPSLRIREYLEIDARIDEKDAEIGRRNLANHVAQNEIDALVRRQEEITGEIGPLILAKGASYWRADDGSIYSIDASHDEALLTVVKLVNPLTLGATEQPRVYTDEAIVEDAFNAAIGDVFPGLIADDDTGEFAPIPDDPAEWAAFPDAGRDIFRLPGREVHIHNGVVVADQQAG